jgi:hypothetical protein
MFIYTNPCNEMQCFKLLLYKENIGFAFIFQTLLTEAKKIRRQRLYNYGRNLQL